MSKSSRQFSQNKESIWKHSSQLSIAPGHGKSVEGKNYKNLITNGRQYYHRNQMVLAIQCFTKSLYYDPNNLEIVFMLAVAYLTIHQYQEALKYLLQVAKINPNHKNNTFMLVSIAYKKIGKLHQSLQAISQHILLHPEVEGYFYRAKLYCKSQDYSKAQEDVEVILKMEPNHVPSIFLKLEYLKGKKDYENAIKHIDTQLKTMEDHQKHQQLKLQKIKIYMLMEGFQLALSELQNIEKQSLLFNNDLYFWKGKILQKMGRHNESIIYFNEILGRNTNAKLYCEALTEISVYSMIQRDFYEAFAYLKRSHIVKVKHKNIDHLLKLAEGVTFLMKKKYGEAILLIGSIQPEQLSHISQHTVFLTNLYYNSLAFAKFSQGDHHEAVLLYKKIDLTELSIDSKSIRYNICLCDGILAANLNNYQRSIELFQEAALHMSRPEPYFYTAVILNMKNMEDSSGSEAFMKILNIIELGLKAGESAHMYYYRAIIYLFLGMSIEALEDIDRAIEKSEDNVAKYFQVRGIIFMLDKNYEQAIVEMGTALSIDDKLDDALIEKCKCELLTGDLESAYFHLEPSPRSEQYKVYFNLYEKNYEEIIESTCEDVNVLQICHFMTGKFENAGPCGKLVMAVIYENYKEVSSLISQALQLGVSVGCLQMLDLMGLKGYSLYKMDQFEESIVTFVKMEKVLKQSSNKSENYCEEDEKRLLLCKINIILINLKKKHHLEAIALIDQLLGQICEGVIFDELRRFKEFILHPHPSQPFQLKILIQCDLISDYLLGEEFNNLKFKLLVPFPNYKVPEVEFPQYQNLVTEFKLEDIENKPEAPWIKRGQYGVIFTNDIQEFENLNLRTQENQNQKNKLKEDLKLGSDILGKLAKITNKCKDPPQL